MILATVLFFVVLGCLAVGAALLCAVAFGALLGLLGLALGALVLALVLGLGALPLLLPLLLLYWLVRPRRGAAAARRAAVST